MTRNKGWAWSPAMPYPPPIGGAVDHRFRVECDECGRVFDLLNEEDAAEWSAGHDCEVQE